MTNEKVFSAENVTQLESRTNTRLSRISELNIQSENVRDRFRALRPLCDCATEILLRNECLRVQPWLEQCTDIESVQPQANACKRSHTEALPNL